MKKLFAFVLFTSFVCQLGAWSHFTIKNDTKKSVEFITESIKKNIPAGKSYRMINPSYSKNPLVTNVENKIILKKNINWFKIGEKTPPAGRTYTIAPRVNIGNNASGIIKVQTILQNKSLPKGFKYHEYAMGLRTPTKIVKNPTRKFSIENDTFFPVTLSACNTNDKIEIKPRTKGAKNKLIPGGIFTVNSVLYKNYKPTDAIAFATRYKVVDEKNMFRLDIQIGETIHKFTIQVTENLEPKTILKISTLITRPEGFKIKSHKKF